MDKIENLILETENKLSEDLKAIWNEIKITPYRWNEETTNRDYWAVAIIDDEVIWYNDVEDGFNMSKFSIEGTIGEYWTDQCSLDDLLWHLF